ncbi:MAG: hypothetical protein IJP38_00535 [Oscillospiraceae bacterium]|nr:hypothetical protein [Oscillospiraceae bacterium]
MNILYCGDKNISDGLIISVLSLLENISEELDIHILTMALETEQKIYEPVSEKLAAKLDMLVKEKNCESAVTLHDISGLFAENMPLANMGTRFTPCCMLRLFADDLGYLPDKILYLDNDVICRCDFSEFYNIDVKDIELAGVRDHYGKWFFGYDYLNSGVLLLNLKKIRETGLFEKCRRMCREKRMFMPDQSAINNSVRSKRVFPRRYNEQRKLHKDTVFQHFTTSFRFFPWFHSVSVKPWQTERMHTVLKLYEYDTLLEKYISFKEEFENEQRNTGVFFD